MPKFKSKSANMTVNEKKQYDEEKHLWQEEYPKLTCWGKFKFRGMQVWKSISDFFFKLQPRYMDRS